MGGPAQFDYVIVDECSQVNLLLGRIAMGKARKHLILTGDDDQLQPITRETDVDTAAIC